MIRTGFRTLRRPVEPRDPDRVRSMPMPTAAFRMPEPVADMGNPISKPVQHRNPFLLTMARGERCVLRVPGVCNDDSNTVVACHSNLGEHAKAGARKADDQWHVFGCSACHSWLDQGRAPYDVKRAAFMAGHQWMVGIWHDIVAGMQPATPREKAAAQWALDRVKNYR